MMLRLMLALSLGLAFAGCAKPKLIPNTKILDNKQNRAVLTAVEKYRRAMEKQDAAQILVLAHPSYRDRAGTPEPQDDVDYEELKNLLRTRFRRASKVRYRIEFQDVSYKGREAHVDTWIDATFVYKLPDGKPRYRRFTDHHRYRLISEQGRWRFIGGL